MLGEIKNNIIHQIGNKANADGVKFSNMETSIGDMWVDMSKVIEKSFNIEEAYQFYFDPVLSLNPIYTFVKNIFANSNDFVAETQNIARYLYEKSTHPKIKGGELWIMYIENCNIGSEVTDAICIIKSENKEAILQLTQKEDNYEIVKREGFGLNKIDKGCLIYNQMSDEGYVCSVIDTSSKKGDEAKFWMDDFLHLRHIKNGYQKTKAAFDAIASYVNVELAKSFDVDKSDQASIIYNSLSEVKSKEDITFGDIKEVAFTRADVREDFERYLDTYQVDNGILLEDDICIEKSAVKRSQYNSITTIKLDSNFDIKIHGGDRLIEKGYDEEMKMNYYKLYFKQEK